MLKFVGVASELVSIAGMSWKFHLRLFGTSQVAGEPTRAIATQVQEPKTKVVPSSGIAVQLLVAINSPRDHR